MQEATLHGWAETTVHAAGEGGKASPQDGDECPECGEPLHEGERVHRVTERADNAWVHDKHVGQG